MSAEYYPGNMNINRITTIKPNIVRVDCTITKDGTVAHYEIALDISDAQSQGLDLLQVLGTELPARIQELESTGAYVAASVNR